ncbi:hypothetical protein BU26DRAFT_600993 [Trematosphaeria pertusa]|uniref:Heterokaryon incompatibility domain-containing protein n=1 Tax=Trematosphaeria pertusa TaxID=390896 RepID=A0A6A6IRD7_9PLEO|nr:uncharacterized protein BU26DRAFT_600993 [Trematosphaeria pertusa]KAF2252737.1 hypothetical protein BU26DRAFT_600993 [Trematosphaeria pertusa]
MASNSLAQVTEGWPLRLLHVDSMTSFQRRDGNVYNGEKEPRYNILTYTWGRFAAEGESSIEIGGDLEWEIPSIKRSHFTAEQFTRIIKKIGAENSAGWVWVDVACIDQRDGSAAKMEEIGRQAAIFQKAQNVYAWLCTLQSDALQQNLDCLRRAARDIEFWNQNAPQSRSRRRWIWRTENCLRYLFRDPWFTSLWTLQEAFLRRDAYILSKQGDAVTFPGETNKAYLFSLFADCSTVYRTILRLTQIDGASSWAYDVMQLDEIIHLIEKSGCYALYANCPITLYGAARFRSASQPPDRIYGIMQVFGLRLGESSAPGHSFSLAQLEFQLGQALNERSPILAQLFVHLTAADGHTWRISENSTTPERGRGVVQPKQLCEISADETGRMMFYGKSCYWPDLVRYWEAIKNQRIRQGKAFTPSIHLDQGTSVARRMPKLWLSLNLDFGKEHDVIAQWIVTECKCPVRAAHLGETKGLFLGRAVTFQVAVILADLEGIAEWSRLGFCMWENSVLDPPATYGDVWSPFEGHLV